jgi:hypothetical protein
MVPLCTTTKKKQQKMAMSPDSGSLSSFALEENNQEMTMS